jgi:hypothetical protein
MRQALNSLQVRAGAGCGLRCLRAGGGGGGLQRRAQRPPWQAPPRQTPRRSPRALPLPSPPPPCPCPAALLLASRRVICLEPPLPPSAHRPPHPAAWPAPLPLTAAAPRRAAPQATHTGFGYVNSENVFRVCDQPHPLVVERILQQCSEARLEEAYVSMRGLCDMGYSSQVRRRRAVARGSSAGGGGGGGRPAPGRPLLGRCRGPAGARVRQLCGVASPAAAGRQPGGRRRLPRAAPPAPPARCCRRTSSPPSSGCAATRASRSSSSSSTSGWGLGGRCGGEQHATEPSPAGPFACAHPGAGAVPDAPRARAS